MTRWGRLARLAGWLLLLVSWVAVAAGQTDGEAEVSATLSDATATVGPRVDLGPTPADMGPASAALTELYGPLERADGKPFTCAAMGLVEVGTGQILYGQNLTERHFPASTTKIMTTLLALEDIAAGKVKLTDKVTISEAAATTPESGLWLQVGEQMTLHDLLIGVMVRSANDASRAVAEYLGGGDAAAFVARMNQRATELGAVDTHFENPHGLHIDLAGNPLGGERHYTTAYDLMLFALAAWRHRFFRELCTTLVAPVSWQQMPAKAPVPKGRKPEPPHPDQRVIRNRNKLLERYDECVGIKTGYTKQAGACLVAAALRGQRLVLAVTMKSASGSDRWLEAEALLRYGLDAFAPTQLVTAGQICGTVPVRLGEAALVRVAPAEGLSAVLPLGATMQPWQSTLPAWISAPLPRAKALGRLSVPVPGLATRELALVTAEAVPVAVWYRVLHWAVWAAAGLAGVLLYGAFAKAARRRRRRLAARRGSADRGRPGQGQRPGGPRAGSQGRGQRPDRG